MLSVVRNNSKRAGSKAGKVNVHNLAAQRQHDTIELLEALLAQAKAGEITGVMVVAGKGTEYSVRLTGDYRRNPMLALAAHSRVGHRLNLLADMQQVHAMHGNVDK